MTFMKNTVLLLTFGISTLTATALTAPAVAAPWGGYGRTYPVPRYLSDISAETRYQFGIKRTYSGYEDPNYYDAVSLPSPIDDHRFDSYNLIVVINDNAREPNPAQWGPAQTMRVYSRKSRNPKGLLYYWGISTGIDRATTKKGYYRPLSFSSRHWSGQYDAPMFFSVFFDGGRALHSSLSRYDLDDLGKRRSSHGCVHIEDNRAEELFHLIGHSGYGTVDLINRSGQTVTNLDGSTKKVQAYKTLIIIH